jgi:hypothetical protein
LASSAGACGAELRNIAALGAKALNEPPDRCGQGRPQKAHRPHLYVSPPPANVAPPLEIADAYPLFEN